MPTTPASRAAHQLAQLLDQDLTHPTQQLAARLTTTAHLLWTSGNLALTRAHEHAPGLRAANTDPHRTHGGDPTATAALTNLDDPTATLDRDLNRTIADLDQAATRLANLIATATTVHRSNDQPATSSHLVPPRPKPSGRPAENLVPNPRPGPFRDEGDEGRGAPQTNPPTTTPGTNPGTNPTAEGEAA